MRGGDTEQMLRRCAERIRQEPQAAELETVLALFASRVMDINLVKQIVRWNMEEIIEELPLMQEFRDKWIERGREDGLEEGERKATLKALRRTLLVRFGAVSDTLDEQLNHLDLATLEQLNEIALTATTLPAFEAALSEILSPPDNDNPAA